MLNRTLQGEPALKRALTDKMKKLALMAILLNFLYFAARFASRPYIAIMAADLGADDFKVGLIIALYSVVQVVCALFIGRLIDKRGQKLPAAAGMVAFIIGTVMLSFTKSLWMVGAATVLLGLAHGIILIASQSIMTAMPGDGSREKYVGYFYFAASAGALIGPAAGGYLQEHLSGGLGFFGATAFGVAAFVLILLMPNYCCYKGEKPTKLWTMMKDKGVMANVMLSALVFFLFDVYSTYLPLYGVQDAGLTPSRVGLILSAGSLASMAIRPLLGKLCQMFTRKRVFMASLILAGICTVFMGLFRSFIPLMAVSLVYGLTYGISNPLTLISVTDVAEPENRNRVIAMRVMANSTAQSVSPVFFGAVAEIAGLSCVFFGSSALMIGCIYMAHKLAGKKHGPAAVSS